MEHQDRDPNSWEDDSTKLRALIEYLKTLHLTKEIKMVLGKYFGVEFP